MKVILGEEGLQKSYQGTFPTEVRCSCGGKARIAFVAHEMEEPAPPQRYVFELHKNGGKGSYWPHDACSVAVYFCRDCLNAVAKFSQR